MSETLKQRNEIDQKYKWNIEDMYQDDATWEADVTEALKGAQDFAKYQGRLTESGETLLEALKARDIIWQKIEKAYVYSRMRRDEDNRVEKYQSMNDKAQAAIAKISTEMSFFTPELLSGDEQKILGYLKDIPELQIYSFMIKDMLREKAHVLSGEEENLLAQLSEITPATNNIFTMLNNADIKFGKIEDEKGNLVDLTHGNYISFMESHNRDVRHRAYEAMYTAYLQLQHKN